MGCNCKETTGGSFKDDCPYLTASYILAGLSMMLNIRLAYSSAPYALIRFKLPENLFSVFVRRMASSLELWCLPSMLMGNIMDVAMKLYSESKDEFSLDHKLQQSQGIENTKLGKHIKMKYWKFLFIIIPSMVTMWSDFITYVLLLYVYVTGGDYGHVTAYYGVIAVSGFIFGINMTLVYAADWRYIPVYIAGENSFPMLTSIIHYLTTLIFGNRRKWNSDFLIVCIDISVAIIISFVTASLWTSAYAIMKHNSEGGKFRFNVLPGQFFTDAYGNTRNTSVTFSVTLGGTGGSNNFASNGTITITVTKGGENFNKINNSGVTVIITLSSDGTIKKYDKEGNLKEIGGTGINEPLTHGTKLEIETTGNISIPNGITGSEVTIKATLVVSSNGNLSTALTLGGDVNGSITPTGSREVTIQNGGTINLTGNALTAFKYLTQNAVTLSGSGSGGFRSSASITITGTNLSSLSVTSSDGLQITSISGTIKRYDNEGKQTDLERDTTPLKVGDKLSLDASGNITQPSNVSDTSVKLNGTIVVTSNEKKLGTEALTFGGGPDRSGVTGSLTLTDALGSTPKHVTISGNLTIDDTAYGKIKNASDGTLKIGAPNSDARDIGGGHKDAIQTGTGASYKYLADEDSFKMYWHLLPPNKYSDKDIPYWTSISPAMMIMVGMGFVFCIYPGIAPGMIVPFYLVDKIETVLLVLTTFPPVIVAILRKHQPSLSPTYNHFGTFKAWYEYPAGKFYLFLNILMVIKMTLLALFIYCLHYRDSHISRSIVNQPKMSTFLSIVFYMCHECLLALGFSGFIGNNGGDFILIPQYIGALLMIFLAFYSEGYIIEYKSHDPAHWPTDGMTWWNSFFYRSKNAIEITNNFQIMF